MLNRLIALRHRMRLARAYQDTFATPAGEIVLHDLLREGGVLSTSVVQGDAGYTTHFNEGKRALALHALDRLRWTEAELATFANQRTGAQLDELTDAGADETV